MILQEEIKKGAIITLITKYTGIVIGLIINSILARLLSPNEFGIVGIITVFVTFFNILSDVGFGPGIVQSQNIEKKQISNIFKISVLLSIILAILFIVLSYIVAYYYQNSDYKKIGSLLSISILFNTLSIVPKSLIIKAKSFKILGIIDICTTTISGIVAIVLVIFGQSYYSIIWRSILISIFAFFWYFNLSRLTITRGFSIKSISKIISYSFFQFSFNFVNYFSRNLDNILIGKYMGNHNLAIYNQSYQLMMYPIAHLTHAITPVLHPILATYSDKKQVIYNEYIKILNLLALLGVPISILLYFISDEIILIVLGEQWKESVKIFKILSMSIWIQMLLSSSGAIFQATGKTKLLFISGLFSAFIMITSILMGIFYFKSLEILSYLIVIGFSINFFQGFYILIKIILKQSFLTFIKVIVIKQIPISIILIVSLFLISKVNIFYISYSAYIYNLLIKLSTVLVVVILFNKSKLKNATKFINDNVIKSKIFN
ncbi:lipopolysaccharide biosynthesis protein [Spirosoma gilvum]